MSNVTRALTRGCERKEHVLVLLEDDRRLAVKQCWHGYKKQEPLKEELTLNQIDQVP